MYVEILILAQLRARPYHGYELKRRVEQVMGDAVTINNHHLYPALRRFEEMGAIERHVERQEGRPDRHMYTITDRGEGILQGLLRDFPADLAQSDSEFYTRVAFFHLVDPATRRAILSARRDVMSRRLGHIKASLELVGEAHPQYAYVTRLLNFQLGQIQGEIDWIDALAQDALVQDARVEEVDPSAGPLHHLTADP